MTFKSAKQRRGYFASLNRQKTSKPKYVPNKSRGKSNDGKKEEIKEEQIRIGKEVESEHSGTIRAIREKKLSNSQAINLVVSDHLKEDKLYYSKLKKAKL